MKQEAIKQLQQYEEDWIKFKLFIEGLAKGRCIITNKNWHKIREIHLSQYLKKMENPFFFLFQIKFFCPKAYRSVKCLPKYYYNYKQDRDISWHI